MKHTSVQKSRNTYTTLIIIHAKHLGRMYRVEYRQNIGFVCSYPVLFVISAYTYSYELSLDISILYYERGCNEPSILLLMNKQKSITRTQENRREPIIIIFRYYTRA